MSKDIELGNMGIGALKSHTDGAKRNESRESVIPFSMLYSLQVL